MGVSRRLQQGSEKHQRLEKMMNRFFTIFQRQADFSTTKQELEAASRVCFKIEDCEDHPRKWVGDPLGLLHWLIDHPQAKCTIGDWWVEITSTDFNDVTSDRFDPPFGINSSVEHHSVGREGEEFTALWHLC